MPELPEVEVVRSGLAQHTTGARFCNVEVLHPRANRGQEFPLPGLLHGAVIKQWCRRGKFLWAELTDGQALYVHLGMSGQMLVGKPGQVTSKHLRIRAELEVPSASSDAADAKDSGAAGIASHRAAGVDKCELAFVDQRTFGRWLVCEFSEEKPDLPEPAAHIAPDPFSPDFDLLAAARAVRKRRSAVKSVLLNQEIVSGIGNIYADEALWAAQIHPATPANKLLQRQAVALLEAAHDVMSRALDAGGTSFDALYVNVNGGSGYFERSLNAYGQTGKPCLRCGNEITRIVINKRSSHFCAVCQ
ncbi:bifunctional DNA-formamidopyrimidine glycosylase/DNA-(apurinic or apyrimidinic site) lyase [Corynebacterium pseudodiphtheriticum]|uniref:bifunctional DNA-formamidopyrimidine glycosylase/DNA-(apurinic or apyrimidinic site) lyase n=1 Tax=Corynebacterium pseudodiphtheriticum TaxID=37637 RepID=UPI0021AEE3A2|nr:bifunctional DNA-formamidopyrimidine glycosylase/DNA-(apurinic or apyrimidinic site) lyase [Corynebacterium pseudodiphtheriticum]MCT1634743.1 bifunctional DNA-formamidopyrimidine glycosylase/DNA-(apurinic or apyrimidinic site) lyase [Corynebacterium pseudodiphtheriticum]MCT1665838.1 bifunctional DNA-formamidopyrimidine glycosylase/DNA-(apurinic or apyrimidinic site) lyase [Corynebacterium pseudodiphtheriticum]MDK4242999.1 bifunctional DNA-formamidopyrimidine glycosylase/DNA-(apurinic or apyri